MLYLTTNDGNVLNWDNIVKIKKRYSKGNPHINAPAGTKYYAVDRDDNYHLVRFIKGEKESALPAEEVLKENIKRTDV